MSLVAASGVWKEFRQGGECVTALRDVTLAIEPGEFLLITGESGSGKSTLLGLLATLDRPTRGAVVAFGRPVEALSSADLNEIRSRRIGVVFQDFLLIRHLSARDNIRLPFLMAPGQDTGDLTDALIARLKIQHRQRQKPDSLSRGEMQRVALARALVHRPDVLFADEPTANLDRPNAELIWRHLQDLNANEGLTVVVATHGMEFADCSTRLVRLNDGRMVADERRD